MLMVIEVKLEFFTKIFREVECHLSDVLIQSINDVDFNTVEHRRTMEIHRKYLIQL